jgi:hypothetical protein
VPVSLRLGGRGKRKPSLANRRLLQGYGDPAAAASDWFRVLKEMTVLVRVSFAYCQQSLRAFARQYGILPEEFPERVTLVVGQVLEETTRGPLSIEPAWLRKHLIGASDALPVAFGPASVSALAVATVRERLGRINIPGQRLPVRRAALADLDAHALRSSVVLLLGRGGCGKSVLALQYLIAKGDSRVVLSGRADGTSETSIAEAFSHLRSPNRGLRPDPTLSAIVRRVREANPGVQTVLLLDVDGVEEARGLADESLRHLIRAYSGGHPPLASGVTLVLSCRVHDSREDAVIDDLIRRLFDCEDPAVYRSRLPVVRVEDFARPELLAAARGSGTALAPFADWLEAQDSPSGPSPDPARTGATYPAQVVESLHHPVVWGAFAGLPDMDQQRILAGDSSGLSRLAEAFLTRFGAKCRDRRPSFMADRADAGLGAVARATRRPPPYSRLNDWLPAAAAVMTAGEADFLFGEAVTYGLVDLESSDQWRWRHTFVADHLASVGEL